MMHGYCADCVLANARMIELESVRFARVWLQVPGAKPNIILSAICGLTEKQPFSLRNRNVVSPALYWPCAILRILHILNNFHIIIASQNIDVPDEREFATGVYGLLYVLLQGVCFCYGVWLFVELRKHVPAFIIYDVRGQCVMETTHTLTCVRRTCVI